MKKEIYSYDDIPFIPDFGTIFNYDYYYKPPPDWYIIITDIINSTTAILEGRYKDVNTAGSLVAMAISNVKKDMNFPFIFGGDGMTFLIPGDILDDVNDVLVDTRKLVEELFDLKLRLGVVPVSTIYRKGFKLFVAKLKVSDRYTQAIISGKGIDLAEKLIKNDDLYNPFRLRLDITPQNKADFTGFTCRWKDIPSTRGETISFIIKIRDEYDRKTSLVFNKILKSIDDIFGHESDYHPLTESNQSSSVSQAYREARIFSKKKDGLLYLINKFRVSMETLLVKLIVSLRLPIKIMNKKMKNVKTDNIINSDFRKFDGSLKMVISCTGSQRREFEKFLGKLYRNGEINYGLHVSDRALLTCLIHRGTGEEVHFVDSADGGYALASRKLKEQIVSG
ncbi:MAG: DUF3095 domain-containing protein [Spirochaetia bacterium]|jgi:hypothetical protein|nr:DUF3095 domain-containing protein [Spirochaetia bacterium]